MGSAHRARWLACLLGAFTLTGLAGCGPTVTRSEVSGTIKHRGKAPGFSGLQIVLTSEDGTQFAADIAEDGTYRTEVASAGELKVAFVYINPNAVGEVRPGPRLQKPGGVKTAAKPKTTGKEPATDPVREDLREASTSKLVLKATDGKVTFDFDLP